MDSTFHVLDGSAAATLDRALCPDEARATLALLHRLGGSLGLLHLLLRGGRNCPRDDLGDVALFNRLSRGLNLLVLASALCRGGQHSLALLLLQGRLLRRRLVLQAPLLDRFQRFNGLNLLLRRYSSHLLLLLSCDGLNNDILLFLNRFNLPSLPHTLPFGAALLLGLTETITLLACSLGNHLRLGDSSANSSLTDTYRSAGRIAKAKVGSSRLSHLVGTLSVVLAWANSLLDPRLTLLTDREALATFAELVVPVIVLAWCLITIASGKRCWSRWR